MARLQRPLQRAFLGLNRGFMAPMLRAGLGWTVGSPLTGHIMVLRTRGRRSGLVREAPLGYVIREGVVYCVAGYGSTTPWFRNLTDDPSVEVILPTRRFRGLATPVEDPTDWLAAYRALVASFGLVGRAVVGDVGHTDDSELLARHGSLPVVGIRPVEGEPPLVAGAFDPGGRGWLLSYGLWLLAIFLVVRTKARH
jgi:deazaflavin-dependent oxidoreductase (nitroreductase family)